MNPRPTSDHWALVLIIVALRLANVGEFSAQVHGAEAAPPAGPCFGYFDPLT